MFSTISKFIKQTIVAFIEDEALTRGAAIAFYTVTSIAPVLLIVIAIAGLAFGQDAARIERVDGATSRRRDPIRDCKCEHQIIRHMGDSDRHCNLDSDRLRCVR
jgi:hypothetical protein